MKNLTWLFLILVHQVVYAQKEQNNWYFGRYAAMSFETGAVRAKYNNPQNTYGRTASISDPNSGNLLFYTDGKTIWNNQHQIMANGGGIASGPIGDVIIFPVPASTSEYYVCFINGAALQYVIVDMSRNGGAGEVSTATQTVSGNNNKQIAVIRHRYADAYWIVVHEVGNNRFRAYYAGATGIKLQPVISDAGLTEVGYGDMTGSNQGHKLAVTHYQGNDNKVEVFDFDPVCGRVSNAIELYRELVWDYAYGIAFSPDDTKLYVTYSYQLSQLVQYYGDDYRSSYFIASSLENYNIMRLGPDQRIYMATHDNGIPGERINAILDPNILATSCNFRETYLRLDEGAGFRRSAQFELPAFATGKRIREPLKDGLFTYTGSCAGDTVKFNYNTDNVYDSLLWEFGDNNRSTELHPVHFYGKGGTFPVTLTIFRCGAGYALKDTVRLDSIPQPDFPADTPACAGKPVVLSGPVAEKYQWSTGETTRTISRNDAGVTWLRSTKGNCSRTDSIRISRYPDLITLLGDEYFLCEDDDELVKLDAGEGFTHYKWTPTEDTTQWIVVRSTGEYFVKVTDNYGCIGDDNTKVKRLCGVLVHFPNVFTPNNDGLNDLYKPSGLDVIDFRINIYNRWGELVFTSTSFDKGWDGSYKNKPAADGVYTYTAEYSGYRQKRLQTFYKKGNITLLR